MHTFMPLAAIAAALNGTPVPQPMERIVITAVASRVAEAADDTPSTTSVIDRDEIEGLLARDVREALRYEPGVSVENGAARFGLGNIAIRGLDGNRVQMLYDGVRLPDGFRLGTFSNASRNPFDLALLSRIEVLRGPGSALYGSDALAGVISMTTLDPGDLLRGPARAGPGASPTRPTAAPTTRCTAPAPSPRAPAPSISWWASRAPTAGSARTAATSTPWAARARHPIPRTAPRPRASPKWCGTRPTAGAGARPTTASSAAWPPTSSPSTRSPRAR